MRLWHLFAGTACLTILLACSTAGEICGVCERPIHSGMGAALTLASGQQVSTCCLRCALHFEEKLQTQAMRLEVEDHTGGGLLEVAAAYVVEGSRVNPCMLPPPREEGTRAPLKLTYDRCAPSMLAFRRKQDARAFVSEHGGTLQPPGHLTQAGTSHQ